MLNTDMERYVTERYGDEMSKARKNTTVSLSSIEVYETEWGSDFTLQDRNTIQKAFCEISGTHYDYAKMKLTELQNYAKWRRQNGLACGDGIFNVQVDPVLAVKNEMVASPEHMFETLNSVFEPPNAMTTDIIYRTFLWLGFSGMRDEDAAAVTVDEVDFRGYQIVHNGESYPIYRESFADLQMACKAQSFYEAFSPLNPNPPKSFRRQDGNLLLRAKANKKQVAQEMLLKNTLRANLGKKIKAAQERKHHSSSEQMNVPRHITYRNIQLSGLFYRALSDERLGKAPDFSSIKSAEVERRKEEGRSYKTGKNFTELSIIRRSAKEYEERYRNWKNAYYQDFFADQQKHEAEAELSYDQLLAEYDRSKANAKRLREEADRAIEAVNNRALNGVSVNYSDARRKMLAARAEQRRTDILSKQLLASKKQVETK